MKLTNKKLRKLFGNLEKNAGVVVDHQLDLIDERLDELEKKEQWRDLMALVQEYKEWCDDDLDFERINSKILCNSYKKSYTYSFGK